MARICQGARDFFFSKVFANATTRAKIENVD